MPSMTRAKVYNYKMVENQTIVFGGGCFWCTEAVFKMLKGVSSVLPGYAGGHVEHPTYEQVSNGNTGHAESVEVIDEKSAYHKQVRYFLYYSRTKGGNRKVYRRDKRFEPARQVSGDRGRIA